MSLRDKFFEPDKPKPAAKPPLAAPVPAAPAQAPPSTYAQISGLAYGVSTETSAAYVTLKAKTDFDRTSPGMTLKKFLDPLQKLPLDEGMKAKTAMAQAEANSSLTVQAVLDTFEILKNALTAETTNFDAFIQKTTASGVTARQQQIEAIKKQVEDLQQQMIQLSTAMAEAQAKIDHATGEFNTAKARRASELEQQKAHYASILQ